MSSANGGASETPNCNDYPRTKGPGAHGEFHKVCLECSVFSACPETNDACVKLPLMSHDPLEQWLNSPHAARLGNDGLRNRPATCSAALPNKCTGDEGQHTGGGIHTPGFDAVDTNKSGFISPEEWNASNKSLFDALDVNKDGRLSMYELMMPLDTNKDGYISPDEWAKGVGVLFGGAIAAGLAKIGYTLLGIVILVVIIMIAGLVILKHKQRKKKGNYMGRNGFSSILSQRPTLKELGMMTMHSGKKVTVIESVAHMWPKVGAQLNFDETGDVLKCIEANEGRNGVESCCKAMFKRWIDGCGVKPVSWEKLLEILKDCGRATLADDVKEALLTK